MTIQQHASFDSSAAELNATSKLVKAWESKNAKNAAKAGGISLMALSLAACGGSSTTTTTATDTTTTDTTTTTAVSSVFTTGIDVLNGTAGDDTFTGDDGVISAADQVNAGEGTDTVKIYGTATTPTMTGVENLEIHHATAANFNIATGDLAGVSSLLLDGFTVNDTTVTIGADDVISIADVTGAAADFHIAAAAAVTSATLNVTNSGATGANNDIEVDVQGSGITAVTINALGSEESFIDVVADNGTTTIGSVTLNATSDLTITDIDEATTVNGAGSTGDLTLSTAVNKMTVTTGSGADSVTLAHAGTVAIEGAVDLGAGDDALVLTSSDGAADLVDSKITLDGGEGDDSITMTVALAGELGALSAANYAKKGITNFEKVVVSNAADDATLDFNRMGISSVDFAAAMTDSNGVTIANGGTIEYSIAADAVTDTTTVTVTGAADAGSNSDELTLVLNGAHALATTNTDFGVTNVANVETLNIVSKNSTSTVTLTTGDNEMELIAAHAKTINVTGDTSLDLVADPLEDTITTFNASEFTGIALTVSFAGANEGVTFTAGGTTDVTLTGSSNADLITVAGGDDRIAAANGIDVITTGAGSDTVDLNEITASTNRDVIKDFDVAKDEIEIGADETEAGTAHTASAAYGTVSAKATSITLADVDVTEFDFDIGTGADLSASLTGSELLKGLSSTTTATSLSVDADDDATYIIAYDGGNAYLYHASETNDDGAVLAAGDIALVATFEDIAVGSFTLTNIDLVA